MRPRDAFFAAVAAIGVTDAVQTRSTWAALLSMLLLGLTLLVMSDRD